MQLPTRLFRTQFVCASCTRRLLNNIARVPYARALSTVRNGFASASSAPRPAIVPSKLQKRNPLPCSNDYSTAATRKSLRLAVIGSGPAGFYTAYRLMGKIQDATVDMYEQLPVPYGLVRFGVAPDHPEVKNCQEKFEEVAESPRFNYIGNIRVGQDVQLAQLKPHYDAILFSYGASEDRKLGIPGESMPGVFSAREFVGWYNGLPEFQNLAPDLTSGDQAVIIGQGNVALDVARTLLSPMDRLKHTDITEQALEVIRTSRIKSVKVVGRRGPLQAAFTVKESRELMNISGVTFEPIDKSFYPPDTKKLPRVQKRIADVLLKGSQTNTGKKSWALEFLQSPTSMNASANTNTLSSVTFAKQTFAPNADPFSKTASVVPADDESITYPASIAFRSVGYKSTPLPGLSSLNIPFDTKLGIIPNDPHGRVITPSNGPGDLTASPIHGVYCAGWVKRGPTGVIASTMEDAFASAEVIAADWEAGVPFLNSVHGERESTGLGWEGVKEDVIASGARPIGWKDWKRIDEAERTRGKKVGKEREKFISVGEMLKVLDS